jgi:hypothetical protein
MRSSAIDLLGAPRSCQGHVFAAQDPLCPPFRPIPSLRPCHKVSGQSRQKVLASVATDTFCDSLVVLACRHILLLAPGRPRFGVCTAVTAPLSAPHHASLVLVNISHLHFCQQDFLNRARDAPWAQAQAGKFPIYKGLHPPSTQPPRPTPPFP